MRALIQSRDGFQSLLRRLCDKSVTDGCGARMTLSAQYGEGELRSVRLSPHASVMVSDLRFRDGLLVSYRLPRDHTEISLCMDGAMRALETDALEVNFGKGELCVLAPGGDGEERSGEMAYLAGRRYRGILLAFSGMCADCLFGEGAGDSWAEAADQCAPLNERGFFKTESPAALQAAFRQTESLFSSGGAPGLLAKSRLMEVLALTARELSGDSGALLLDGYEAAQIRRARTILEENMANPPSVGSLAAMLGLNRNKLQRGFRQIYGDTVFGFLREMRMQRARTLLMARSMSVESVAAFVGYTSVSQFRATFQDRFDMLPSQCRIFSS